MNDDKANRFNRLAARFCEYREWVSLAKEQTGKSFATQIREIQALKSTGGQCGISDYYWHKLYDDDYQMGRGAKDFLGWRLQQKLSLALNPRLAVLPAWDKLTFTQIATAAGLPVAPIRASFHRSPQISAALGSHLDSKEAVGKFLRDPSNYPLFAKPSFSQQSYGSAYLASYDKVTDRLILLDDSTISVAEFLRRLEETVDYRYHKPECGFLFQLPLTLAPEILALTDWPAVCGVRVICINGPEEARPIRAAWKIALKPNHMDNFGMGSHGNLLADVDLETGKISKVIGGFWPKTRVYKQHPVSGKSFENYFLPGWDHVLDACKRGGAVFPLMKIHHWDFAITDQGPMILELNDIGGTQIAQMHGHGLLTEETREFLKRHANAQARPWVKAL